MDRRLLSCGALAAVFSCGPGERPQPGPIRAADAKAAAAVADEIDGPLFQACANPATDPPMAAAAAFEHKRTALAIVQGPPVHVAHDAIVVSGNAHILEGKFAYGPLGKDLEDEMVEAFIHDCDGWRSLGTARTDDDGRARVAVPEGLSLPTGSFAVRMVVRGDGSAARSRMTVVPSGAKLVLFDIDGTLTVSDGEITREVVDDYWEDLYDGDYVPRSYEGAADVTRAWAERGFLVYYLTGRPYWLGAQTRKWLADHAFADGHVRTTDRTEEVIPTPEGVGAFKRGVVTGLVGQGLVVQAAYGNAVTDIAAYAAAGIPLDRTWIIGPHAGEGGTGRTGTDYRDHLGTVVNSVARAVQPYATQAQRVQSKNKPQPAAK